MLGWEGPSCARECEHFGLKSIHSNNSLALVLKRRESPDANIDAFLLSEEHSTVQADIAKWADKDGHVVELKLNCVKY